MHVDAKLRRNPHVEVNAFHGFHVHANDNPANGRGCVADPSDPSSTWFVSADGHLSASGQTHGEHSGDLPSPLVMADGTARLSFSTDRIKPEVLRGTAVILHDMPDNFGNVPPTDYTANSPEAIERTAATGNAGDRVACGLLRRSD
jgi:superoxide dismutase, Cu-Zn family